MSEVAAAGGSGLTRHIEAHLAFADVWHTLLFLAVVWIVGKIFHKCGAPSLVGEILVGALAGPQGWDLVPNPTALMLFGEIGLILLVLEAGLDVDLQVLKAIGLRGLGVALVGSLAPLGIGIGLACGALGLGWQAGLTAGCTLAPTSMGIALRVLKTCKVLHTPSAQLIICAAIIDDVIALILLSQLQAIAAHRAGVLYLLQPILVSVTLVLGLGALGIVVVPRLMRCTISRLPESAQSMARMCALGAAAFGLIMLCDVAGSSHLLGGFLAGLCFCSDAEVRALWHHQVKRLLQWLIKLFFAATIGFEVPIRTFGDLEVVGHAAVFLIALLGKLATGVWAKPLSCVNALMVAFAMSAWGEFAFVIATAGRVARLIDSTTFSALILAVTHPIPTCPHIPTLYQHISHT
jgi:Kef-type K+ transport system membrane component KefB